MGGRGSSSRIGGVRGATAEQSKKMQNMTRSLSKRSGIIDPITFTKKSDGSIAYTYTERKVFASEKGGKMQSATKADTVERITVQSGIINKYGIIKKNKPVKEEKVLKRGRL